MINVSSHNIKVVDGLVYPIDGTVLITKEYRDRSVRENDVKVSRREEVNVVKLALPWQKSAAGYIVNRGDFCLELVSAVDGLPVFCPGEAVERDTVTNTVTVEKLIRLH